MSIASPSPFDSLSQDLVLHILDSRDAEGERTGERPRKRSRLPISPMRGG